MSRATILVLLTFAVGLSSGIVASIAIINTYPSIWGWFLAILVVFAILILSGFIGLWLTTISFINAVKQEISK